MKIFKNSLFTFFFGLVLAGLLSLYGIRNLHAHFYMGAIHDSVYMYETALKQDDKDEIIKRLNASISCALNAYEENVKLGLSSRIDSNLNHILTKAHALRDLPCDYPLIINSN